MSKANKALKYKYFVLYRNYIMNHTNEEKDRKKNPYYYDDNDIAEDDYSEESNSDSVYKENEMSND